MPENTRINQSDLPQGATSSKTKELGRLSIKAILRITDLVESLHKRIHPLVNNSATTNAERLSGISGSVYNNIRNVTDLVGKTIEAPLDVISQSLASNPTSFKSQAMLSVLNGVIGDQLAATQSPLAIKMQLRKDGISLDKQALLELIQKSQGKILILVHGLCMNDLQWCYEGHDHGEKLAEELGMSVVYLHYNTGLHISENGEAFATILQSLASLSEQKLEICIVAHSMGGLVSRSAFYCANNAEHSWPKQIKKLIFLGTPHHGAPLEKAGSWLDIALAKNHYTIPFARLVKVRSAGITDLRFGNVKKSDWDKSDRFENIDDQRSPVALPENLLCYAVATSATDNPNSLVGDGLVTVNSALGKHQNPLFDLDILEKNTWVGTNVNHFQLLGNLKVYHILKHWLAQN